MSKHITLENLNVALPPIKHLIDKKAEGVDWNENDPAASGYIKNRPFYSYNEAVNGEYIFYETAFTGEQQGDNLYVTQLPESSFDFETLDRLFPTESTLENADFVVVYDNETYEIKCVLHEGMPYLGNLNMMGGLGEDTGEPFLFLFNGIIGVTTPGEHTISVKTADTIEKKYVKIDEKYLPEIGEGANIGIIGLGQDAEVFNGGFKEQASGDFSHAEGVYTSAGGYCAHAEGNNTTASGDYSHTEGYHTRAGNETIFTNTINSTSYRYGHAEGYSTLAKGTAAHAEGQCSTASARSSHAEGERTTASGLGSHAEGMRTFVEGAYAHTEGYWTNAMSDYQHVQGKYNIGDYSAVYAHIVGNGTSAAERSNAHTLDWDGLGWFAGGLKVGGTGQDDTAAVEVALKTDIVAITTDEIDAICGATIYTSEEVEL